MKKYKLIKQIEMDHSNYEGCIETKEDWLEQYGLDIEKLPSYFLEIEEKKEPKFKVGSKIKISTGVFTTVVGITDSECLEDYHYYVACDNEDYSEEYLSPPTDYELGTYF